MPDSSSALVNIGRIISGVLEAPLLAGDAILIRDGRIEAVGASDDPRIRAAEIRIDVDGMTVAPGLIDCHAHPVFGEWTPRLGIIGWIEWALQGGVTSMISAGTVHLTGRPTDRAGAKALAILAHKTFQNVRPSGVKVHAGSVLLEHGLVEQDFEEMAAEGVWLVGEVGVSSVTDPAEAAQMARWAQARGMKVLMHAGGVSAPGSSTTSVRAIRTVRPDVVAHINGGSTALPESEVDEIVRETDFVMDIALVGNPKVRSTVLRWLSRHDQLRRVMLGVDAPGGTGVFTLGMLRSIMEVVAIDGLPPAVAIALAAGNTADVYGLPTGKIEVGREADLVVLDAPVGSPAPDALAALERGDIPGVAGVLIDGALRVERSRLTPPSKRGIQAGGVS